MDLAVAAPGWRVSGSVLPFPAWVRRFGRGSNAWRLNQNKNIGESIVQERLWVSGPAGSALCPPCRGSEAGIPGIRIPGFSPRWFHLSLCSQRKAHDRFWNRSGTSGTGLSKTTAGLQRSVAPRRPWNPPHHHGNHRGETKYKSSKGQQNRLEANMETRKPNVSGPSRLLSSSFPPSAVPV